MQFSGSWIVILLRNLRIASFYTKLYYKTINYYLSAPVSQFLNCIQLQNLALLQADILRIFLGAKYTTALRISRNFLQPFTHTNCRRRELPLTRPGVKKILQFIHHFQKTERQTISIQFESHIISFHQDWVKVRLCEQMRWYKLRETFVKLDFQKEVWCDLLGNWLILLF